MQVPPDILASSESTTRFNTVLIVRFLVCLLECHSLVKSDDEIECISTLKGHLHGIIPSAVWQRTGAQRSQG